MTAVNTTQIKNDNTNRCTAIILLKYFISTGRETIPTAIIVDTKAATCIYPAPAFSKAPPRGNATKLGIATIDPITKAIIAPRTPDSAPIRAVITFLLTQLSHRKTAPKVLISLA